MRVHRRALQQLDDEGIRVVHSVGCQLTHLIHRRVAHHLILVGHGEHLVVGQRLVEGDESQLAVEGVFVLVQQACALHFLVVAAGNEAYALHVTGNGVHAAHTRRIDQREQVVGTVVGLHIAVAVHSRTPRLALAEVGQGQDVAVLRNGGTHIRPPHLDAENSHIGVCHRQGAHGPVVVVVEVLRYEVVAVVLILVGTDLELVAARSALHLHVLRAGLLLAHHGIHRQLAELQLGVESEQLLATLDEGRCQRERDVRRLEQLQNVVFLAFVFQLQLVLEVEGGIGVVVDVETDQVAYLGIEVNLQVLVEVEGGHTPLAGIALGVVAVVVHNLERQLRTAAGGNLDFRLAHQRLQLLADLVESGNFAQQASLAVVQHRAAALILPVLAHQLLHLPVLVVLETHVLAAYLHVAHHLHLHIVAMLGVVHHGVPHALGRIAAAHRSVVQRVTLRPRTHVNTQSHSQQ